MAIKLKTSSDNLDFKENNGNIKLKTVSGGGSVFSVTGKSGEVILTAEDIAFNDGMTFQEKYNSGELNGKDGYTPVKGKDYFDGENGVDGKDGYTPVKGVDYYTEADKQEIVNSVIAALPSSEEVNY